MRPHNRIKRRFCTKKGEGIFIIKGKKRESEEVYQRAAKKGIYLAIEITIDGTSILCGKERWEEEDDARLQISK